MNVGEGPVQFDADEIALLALVSDPGQAASLTREQADVLLLRLDLLRAGIEAVRTALLRLPRADAPPKPTREPDELLTAAEAAALLRVPVRRMYRDATLHRLARHVGGRTLRWSRAALLRRTRSEG